MRALPHKVKTMCIWPVAINDSNNSLAIDANVSQNSYAILKILLIVHCDHVEVG